MNLLKALGISTAAMAAMTLWTLCVWSLTWAVERTFHLDAGIAAIVTMLGLMFVLLTASSYVVLRRLD